MVVVRISYDQVLLPIGQCVRQHTGFALVHSGSGTRPVRFVYALLVLGVGKVSNLQLPAAPTSDDVLYVIWKRA